MKTGLPRCCICSVGIAYVSDLAAEPDRNLSAAPVGHVQMAAAMPAEGACAPEMMEATRVRMEQGRDNPGLAAKSRKKTELLR